MFSLLIAFAMTAPSPRFKAFIKYMSEKNGITEAEAEKNIEILTSSVYEYFNECPQEDLNYFCKFGATIRIRTLQQDPNWTERVRHVPAKIVFRFSP